MLLENKTGEVHALLVERTLRKALIPEQPRLRQPGSAIKPLVVYSPALEKGIPQRSHCWMPLKVGNKTFHNYDHKYEGMITMRYAVQCQKHLCCSSAEHHRHRLRLGVCQKTGYKQF